MTAEEIKDLVCGKCQDDYCEVNEGANCQHLNDMLDKYEAKEVCPECGGEKLIYEELKDGVAIYGCPKCQAKDGRDERRKGIFKAIESAKFTMEHATLTGTDIKVTNIEPYEATEAVIRFLEGE